MFHMDIVSVARDGLESAQGALEKTAVRLASVAAPVRIMAPN